MVGQEHKWKERQRDMLSLPAPSVHVVFGWYGYQLAAGSWRLLPFDKASIAFDCRGINDSFQVQVKKYLSVVV